MAYRRQLSCHSVSSGLSTASAASLLSYRKRSSMFTLTGCLSLLEKSPSSAAASASSSRSIFNTSFFGKCGIEFGVSFGLWLWLTSCVSAKVIITAPVFSRQARTASTSLLASGSLGLIRKCLRTLYSLADKAESLHEGKC